MSLLQFSNHLNVDTGKSQKKMLAIYILLILSICLLVSSENGNLVVVSSFASEKEFPHAALIGYQDSKDDSEYQCGGSIISNRYILSGIICTYSPDVKEAKFVLVGNVTRGEPNVNTFKYEIVETIKHPEHKMGSIDHDIALFKLSESLQFNDYVKSIKLPTKDYQPARAVFAGYGQSAPEQALSKKLKKITMDVFSQINCQEKFKGLVIDYETKLCAGSKTVPGIDGCFGDSGYPLQIFSDEGNQWVLIGVNSFGIYNCGTVGVPGVYTRVWHYKVWIDSYLN